MATLVRTCIEMSQYTQPSTLKNNSRAQTAMNSSQMRKMGFL